MEKKIITAENVAPELFAKLKDVVSTLLPRDRYVALVFDHTTLNSVSPHLFATKKAANKVQHKYIIVVTVRLLTCLLYQPIGCLFWNGHETKCLAELIHVYINALTDARFRVVATVCPSEYCFINVVQHMTKIENIMTHKGPIIFSTHKVKNLVHIFDPPKLLRDFRDSYMHYDILFKIQGKEKYTSWLDLETWYSMNDNERCMREYEDAIFPTTENLCNTTLAAKIFSHTVSSSLLEYSKDSDDYSESLESAAALCKIFNTIFDFFNASFNNNTPGPPLRQPFTRHSIPIKTWETPMGVLNTMYFLLPSSTEEEDNEQKVVSPKQAKQSGKNKNKKLQKKNENDQKSKSSTSKTDNVDDVANKLKEMDLKKEVEQKETKQEDNATALSPSSTVNNKVNPIVLKKFKFPIIHYWMLNIVGIKVLTEKLLTEYRFEEVGTKCLNVDNIQSFFNIIRVLNKAPVNLYTHEPLCFATIDNETANMCLKKSTMYALAPDDYNEPSTSEDFN